MGGTTTPILTQEELEEQRRREAEQAQQQEQQQQEPPKTAAELVQQTTQQNVETLKGAGETFVKNTESALEDLKGKEEQRIKDVKEAYGKQADDIQKQYDAIYGPEGTLTKAYEERKKQLEDDIKEDVQRKRTDYNTAKWAGITEFASALVNLGMVTGAGANSITVPEYSKDWMKKADADSKERRQRIDRLRDNITAQQERLNQARLSGSLSALGKRQEGENKAIEMEGALGKTVLGTRLQIEGARYQNASAVANAQAQGAYHTAGMMQHEEDRKFRAEESRKSRANTAAQQAAALRARGYNPDGTVNEEYMKTLRKFSDVNPKREPRGEQYRIYRKDGSESFVRMSKETRKRALLGAGEELKKDIMRDAGFNGTWEEFVEATGKKKVQENGKKIPNPLYGKYDDIIVGLNESGDERYEAIEAYLEQHPGSWEVGELLARYNGVTEGEDGDGDVYDEFK